MIKTAFDKLYTELSININYDKKNVSKILLNDIKKNTCKSYRPEQFEEALSDFFTNMKTSLIQVITTDDIYNKAVEEAFDICYL